MDVNFPQEELPVDDRSPPADLLKGKYLIKWVK